ncbi:MAG TPA: hypothetical protein VK598_00340 [Nitrospiraceae bacterium]|nr:hypothetical protein [Nitrospiraceae bacterium]
MVIYLSFLFLILTISQPPSAISSAPSDAMALVPAGEFLMGNPVVAMVFPTNSHNASSTPQHSGSTATKSRMIPMQDLSRRPAIARPHM